MAKTVQDLPKWAQELFHAEALKGALRWPAEPDPVPLLVDNDCGVDRSFEGQTVWTAYVSHGSALSVKEYVIKHGYFHSPGSEGRLSGSRGRGAYYATKEDALLAAQWKFCRDVAAALLRMRSTL